MKIFPAIDIKDKKCVRLIKGDFENKTEYKSSPIDQAGKYKDHGFITFGKKFNNNKHSFNLSKNNDLNEAASNLYKILRKIKEDGYKKIFVVKIPNKGAGVAINDRLKRASQ